MKFTDDTGNKTHRSLAVCAALTACAALMCSCATGPLPPGSRYTAEAGDDLLSRHCPVFMPKHRASRDDLIGTATAKIIQGRERIRVDTGSATAYTDRQEFTTKRGRYTNLIYRIHFPGIPITRLGAGRNAGIIIIVTLNAKERPVLFTSVHTCGCYIAVIPTSHLPTASYPEGWDTQGQKVIGERLPGVLRYPADDRAKLRALIIMRKGTHRVMDVRLVDYQSPDPEGLGSSPLNLVPVAALAALPLGDGTTTPFFETRGRRKGYVKESRAHWEMLLMGWWAFDPFIGRSKAYGPHDETGTTFFTSLKFWHRSDSDLWRFPECLAYYGWRL